MDNAPDGGYFVECRKCLCATRIIYPNKCDPRRELEEAWNTRDGELAAIGARWKLNSSLEEWFPITAEELEKCTNRIITLELENALLRQANAELSDAGPGASKCKPRANPGVRSSDVVRPYEIHY